MHSFLSDLRQGLRLLWKSPGFTAASIVTLGLGIGASTAIFSVVRGVLLRPLPFPDSGSIVRLWENHLQEEQERNPVSPPNFLDWQSQNQVFAGLAGYVSWSPNAEGPDGAERLQGAQVSHNLFRLLGVRSQIGRWFDSDSVEDQVVISYSLWERRFALDPRVTGRTMTLNRKVYTVIGVMPPEFEFPVGGEKRELWVPLIWDQSDREGRATRYLQVVGRLKPEISVERARSEMRGIAQRIAKEYPQSNAGWSITLLPLYEQLVADTRPMLLVLLAAVGFVLLIGCANVANLLLARASGRHKDLAIRVAIGASRGRILRQLLTEGLILALLGGLLGVLLASWALRMILATAPENIPRLQDVKLDGWILVFGVALSLFTALLFGLFPALQGSKPDLARTLKEGGSGATGGLGKLRFRSLLVVSQVAMALVLLIGAGLMIKSFTRLLRVNSGFDAREVLTAQLTLPGAKYPTPEQQSAFFDQWVESVGSLPGVRTAAVISYLPLSGSNMEWVFSIEDRKSRQPGEKLFAEYRQISDQYFKAMGIPLLQGRTFSRLDGTSAPRVILINETFARKFFAGQNPLHEKIGFGRKPDWREVIGVVADVRHFGLEQDPKPEAYVPYQQDPWPSMALVVRSTESSTRLIGAIKDQLRILDKEQPVYNIQTLQSLVAESVASKRLAMILLTLLSSIALVLAAVGIFGVMATSVIQRTHEIGIRVALGAKRSGIYRLVVFQATGLAALGVLLGLAASTWLTRFLSSMLFEVSANDPAIFNLVSAGFVAVLIVASYIPARRAMAVDPIKVLTRD